MKHDKALEERAKRAARSPAFIGLVAGSNDYGEILYKQGALDERAAINAKLLAEFARRKKLHHAGGVGHSAHSLGATLEIEHFEQFLHELLKEGV